MRSTDWCIESGVIGEVEHGQKLPTKWLIFRLCTTPLSKIKPNLLAFFRKRNFTESSRVPLKVVEDVELYKMRYSKVKSDVVKYTEISRQKWPFSTFTHFGMSEIWTTACTGTRR